MNEHDTEQNKDAWDQGIYQTGSTTPPKNHGGLVAVLLILVIFLGGISSALGLLNIRLFRQVNESQPDETAAPVSFSKITEAETIPKEQAAPQVTRQKQKQALVLELAKTPIAPANVPQEKGLALQDIYKRSIHSVVSITCAISGGSSGGTGVVLSRDGYLVTNSHVVENAQSIQVQLTDGRILPASLVGRDIVSDLAVLRVEAEDLEPAQFGDSAALQVGDAVVAIGDPLGVELRGTMTDGIVSAINRDITTGGRTMTLIQTNAALNAGNSGGPLINCYGQVVGINTMKIGDYMSASGVEGLGFAIPSTTVKDVVEQLIAQGYVSGRPTLGIEGEEVSTFYQLYYHLPQGIYIRGVSRETVGLQEDDILLALDGVRITDGDTLKAVLYDNQVGDVLDATVYRNGRQITVRITVLESKG